MGSKLCKECRFCKRVDLFKRKVFPLLLVLLLLEFALLIRLDAEVGEESLILFDGLLIM